MRFALCSLLIIVGVIGSPSAFAQVSTINKGKNTIYTIKKGSSSLTSSIQQEPLEGHDLGNFNVNLDEQPTSDVTVTITGHEGKPIFIYTTTFTFTTDNWAIPQNAHYRPLADANSEDDVILMLFTASGGGYDNEVEKWRLTIADRISSPGIYATGHNHHEGGVRDIGVNLVIPPTVNVGVTITGHESTMTLAKTVVNFTPENWWMAQYVEATTKLDDNSVDETITLTFTASGGEYDGVTYSYDATINDRDVASADIRDYPKKINSQTPFTITFFISEPVTDFADSDITISGGTKGKLSGSGQSYTLPITPTGGSDVTVSVNANSITNSESNTFPATSFSRTMIWDAKPPEVTIIGIPKKINSAALLATIITFDEWIDELTLDDLHLSSGTMVSFTKSLQTEYFYTFNPKENSDFTLTVLKDAVSDGINTGPSTNVSATAIWDTDPPNVTISGVPDKINSKTPFTAIFQFDEEVMEFASGDVVVSEAIKGEFLGTGDRYTQVITPTGKGDAVIKIVLRSATDGANWGPTGEVKKVAKWDATAPTLEITGVPEKINTLTPFTASFKFSEAVTEFTASDVTVTGATEGAFGGTGSSYTLVLTPTGNTDVVVTVDANAATDGLNTGPSSDVTATGKWDNGAPTVEISGLPPKINTTSELTVNFTFNETVTEFAATDVTVTGATKGDFGGTGSSYTLELTPLKNTNVVVTVDANAATDGLNTGPSSDVTAMATWDNDPPTVEISDLPSKINSTSEVTVSFTFNETVTEFTASDVTVTGATKGDFGGTETSYTLELTPLENTNVTVTVDADAATDGLNTGPSSDVFSTAIWDSDPPTLEISGLPPKINATSELTVNFTFNETVTEFTVSDVTVTGATKGDFGGAGTSYTLELTPLENTNVVVTVDADAATDGLNAGPSGDVSSTAIWDNSPPTIIITGVPNQINTKASFTATFTFSEAIDGFASSDINVSGASKGAFNMVSSTEYTVVVTPTGNTNVVITVIANAVTDGLNSGPASSVSFTANWESEIPTVTISGLPNKINSTAVLTTTFTFSEDVTGFITGDVSVTGGQKGTFTAVSATVYRLSITPSRNTNVVVIVNADAATDGLNSGPPTDVSDTAIWDSNRPTLTISGVPEMINSTTAFTATFTFNEAVNGFAIGDVSVSGGSKGAFTPVSSTVYALVVIPSGDTDVVVAVAEDVATDGLNMGPSSAVSEAATWDSDPPTVTISGIPDEINTTTDLTATFTFSEDVTGFIAGDVSVTGGQKGTFTSVSASVYRLTVTPSANTNLVVAVDANSATDGLNTGPPTSVSTSARWDSRSPQATVSGMPNKINSTAALTATFTFSEDVTGFISSDITVTGGTKGTFTAVSSRVYSLAVTPTGNTDVVVTVTEGSASDGLNNGPLTSVTATAIWDSSRPTVTISGVPNSINSTNSFITTFAFSEAVTGFTIEDIIIDGGSTGELINISSSQYSVSITPSGNMNVVVTVVTNAATDGLNLGPPNSTSATATWESDRPTVTISGVPNKINSTSTVTTTFTFSKDVTGFLDSDIEVTGGDKGLFTPVSASQYRLMVTPSGNTDLVITVDEDAASDGFSTGPPTKVSATATWDSDPPSVSITGLPDQISSTDPFPLTFTFSEPVNGFSADGVTVVGAKKGEFTPVDATIYRLVITPSGNANVVVTVKANAATDGLNAGPIIAVSATALWSADHPTVTIGGIPDKINSITSFTLRFEFNTSVMGFESTDVTVTGGTKGGFATVDASNYTLEIIPSGNADVTVTVVENAAISGINQGPPNAVSATAVWDSGPPTVMITDLPDKINSTSTVTAVFMFNENVMQFTEDDVTVDGGSKGNFTGSGNRYSLSITPSGGSNVLITVGANTVTDGINTGPTMEVSALSIWDSSIPSMTISGIPEKINSIEDFTAIFTFSEDVTEFDAADVSVTGGKKGSFTSNSAAMYAIDITPSGDTDVVVSIAANAATDGLNRGPSRAISATAIWENNIALVISPTKLTIPEGGSARYTVHIASQPSEEVTVTVSSSSSDLVIDTDGQVSGNQSTMTFTAVTWNIDQMVAVYAEEDDDGIDNSEQLTNTASGGEYGSISEDVQITITDNDETALIVTPKNLTIDEGAIGSYRVQLSVRPTGPVTVTVGGISGNVLRVDADATSIDDQRELLYSTVNWNVAQVVTVYATDVADPQASPTLLTNTASGGDYGSAQVENVEVTVRSINDAPLTLSQIPDQFLIEGGAAVRVDLSSFFDDVDGDMLRYSAQSSDQDIVIAEIDATVLVLSPVLYGVAMVSIVANDPGGLSAVHDVQVTVSDHPQRDILQNMLAATMRNHLASLRIALDQRMEAGLCYKARVQVMGHSISKRSSDIESVPGQFRSQLYRSSERPTDMPYGHRPIHRVDQSKPAQGLKRVFHTNASEFIIGWGDGSHKNSICAQTARRWTLWGQGDLQVFTAMPQLTLSESKYDARLQTAYVGVDTQISTQWMVGLAVSRSKGSGDWQTGNSLGELTQLMTAIYPYMRWANGGTSVLASFGAGRANARNRRSSGKLGDTGIQLQLGMIEIQRRLGILGRINFDMKMDGGWGQLLTDDGPETIDGHSVVVNQIRLGTNISAPIRLGTSSMNSFGTIYARHDGGAGQTGMGIEIAGGVQGIFGRVTVDASGRILTYHSSKDYNESGISLTASYDLQRSQDGLSISLTPRWGHSDRHSDALLDGPIQVNQMVDSPNTDQWGFDARANYAITLSEGMRITWHGGYDPTHRAPNFGIQFLLNGKPQNLDPIPPIYVALKQ